MTEWVYTVTKALCLLGGKAHSTNIANKCLEFREQNSQDDLKATVRDALQRYSSMSAKGEKKQIAYGSLRDVFHFEPTKRNSIFWISSYKNPIVQFVQGKLDVPAFKEILRNSDESGTTIENLSATADDAKTVHVREHWRNPPSDENSEYETVQIDHPRFAPIRAWCTNSDLEVELKSSVIIRVPLWWFPKLTNASQQQRSNIKYSSFGIHWPDINEDISVVELLCGEKASNAVPPKGGRI